MKEEIEQSDLPKTIKEIKKEIRKSIGSKRIITRNNTEPLYRSVLLQNIFTYCTKKKDPQVIRMVAKQLNDEVYARKEFLNSVMDFAMKDGNQLFIITDKIPPRQDQLNAYEVLHIFMRDEAYRNRVRVFEVAEGKSGEFKSELQSLQTPFISSGTHFQDFHFTITTCGAYQLEFNKPSHSFKYSFGEENNLYAPVDWFDSTLENMSLTKPDPLVEDLKYIPPPYKKSPGHDSVPIGGTILKPSFPY